MAWWQRSTCRSVALYQPAICRSCSACRWNLYALAAPGQGARGMGETERGLPRDSAEALPADGVDLDLGGHGKAERLQLPHLLHHGAVLVVEGHQQLAVLGGRPQPIAGTSLNVEVS